MYLYKYHSCLTTLQVMRFALIMVKMVVEMICRYDLIMKRSKISENSSHLWYTFDPLPFNIHKLQETLEGCTTKNRQYSYNLKELMTANMLTKICGTFPTSSCSTRGWLWENKLEHCVLNWEENKFKFVKEKEKELLEIFTLHFINKKSVKTINWNLSNSN